MSKYDDLCDAYQKAGKSAAGYFKECGFFCNRMKGAFDNYFGGIPDESLIEGFKMTASSKDFEPERDFEFKIKILLTDALHVHLTFFVTRPDDKFRVTIKTDDAEKTFEISPDMSGDMGPCLDFAYDVLKKRAFRLGLKHELQKNPPQIGR
jgi:hypothetical protein